MAHNICDYFKNRYHLLEGIRSAFCSFYIWLFVIVVFAFTPNPSVPITIDYEVQEQEIVIQKGYLLHEVYYYHERINPFIMKSKIKYEKSFNIERESYVLFQINDFRKYIVLSPKDNGRYDLFVYINLAPLKYSKVILGPKVTDADYIAPYLKLANPEIKVESSKIPYR